MLMIMLDGTLESGIWNVSFIKRKQSNFIIFIES